ncbi:MAG: hypothetical protein ONA69_01805 [candidate division KSB1 bacterium]|nr:hypothetical protein [candidate division KSB1 bacterium]MDZ7345508.1 hypothetical protein [candidate division KSB1 bacterium]
MRAAAPGKLILSGEHAVVHGAPALAAAVNRFAYAEIELIKDDLEFYLGDYPLHFSLSESEFYHKLETLSKIDQRRSNDPTALLIYLIHIFKRTYGLKFPRGLRLRLQSDLPIGSGMGSSAAVILAVLRVLHEFFDIPFQADKVFPLALEAENLQHGRSSGLDPYLALHGGFVLFQKGSAEPLPQSDLPFLAVDTGKPEATTGECVIAAAKEFADGRLAKDFAAVTRALCQALENGDAAGVRDAVRSNHRLLCRIGVTPPRVQEFIERIEAEGGAAKISGAGSIRGNAAGMVIVFHDEPSTQRLAKDFGYRLLSLKGEPHGARLV